MKTPKKKVESPTPEQIKEMWNSIPPDDLKAFSESVEKVGYDETMRRLREVIKMLTEKRDRRN